MNITAYPEPKQKQTDHALAELFRAPPEGELGRFLDEYAAARNIGLSPHEAWELAKRHLER